MKKILLFLLCLLFASSAFAAGSTSNTLTWDYGTTYDVSGNPNGITATLIFRKAEACTGTGTFAQIAAVPFPTFTYDDLSIKQGVTYCYEAKAQNPLTVSDPSNLVAKTVPFAIPPVPANVIVK